MRSTTPRSVRRTAPGATAAGLTAMGLAALMAACATSPRGATGEVSVDVVEALRADGEARVVVALALPAGFDAEPGSEETRAEIGRVQDDVLATLDPADFRLHHRFTNVPALAGTVLTERGLNALSRHPSVIRVDLDEPGAGSPDREPS